MSVLINGLNEAHEWIKAQIENLTLFPRIILLLDEIKLHATVISSSEMTETTTAQAPETVTAGATETEMSRERDGEEEEKIRRQKKLEEALEAKSLRRIMSAYLKYIYPLLVSFFLLNLSFGSLYILRIWIDTVRFKENYLTDYNFESLKFGLLLLLLYFLRRNFDLRFFRPH